MPVKRQKQKQYPNLPRMPRFRLGEDQKSKLSGTIKYRKVIWSKRTVTATGLSNLYSDVDLVTSTGASYAKTFQNNKDWKQLVAKGQDACYPYSRAGGTCYPATFGGTSSGNGQTSVSRGAVVGSTLINQNSELVLKDRALATLKRKLNGNIGNAQLAPPLAESHEIHQLVKSINGSAMEALRTLLTIKRTHGKSAIKAAAKVWLTFGFGINPLLKDVKQAADSIVSYLEREDRTVVLRGAANTDYFSGDVSSIGNVAEGVLCDCIAQAHHELGCQYKAGIALNVRSSASYSVADHLGLKVGQLPSILWELTPYSWAVDYFTTVGPWLDDVFFSLPGRTIYCSYTLRYKVETTWSLRFTHNSLYKANLGANQGKLRYFSLVRSAQASIPTRSLRVKSTDEIAMYGLTKVLNLASALAGRIL